MASSLFKELKVKTTAVMVCSLLKALKPLFWF